MILYERACIGEPIGLLISPSAYTFTLSGRCARVKKVRVCAVYTRIYADVNELSVVWNTFIIAQICRQMKNLFREHHRKKSFPVAIVFILNTRARMTLSMMLAANIFNFIDCQITMWII